MRIAKRLCTVALAATVTCLSQAVAPAAEQQEGKKVLFDFESEEEIRSWSVGGEEGPRSYGTDLANSGKGSLRFHVDVDHKSPAKSKYPKG